MEHTLVRALFLLLGEWDWEEEAESIQQSPARLRAQAKAIDALAEDASLDVAALLAPSGETLLARDMAKDLAAAELQAAGMRALFGALAAGLEPVEAALVRAAGGDRLDGLATLVEEAARTTSRACLLRDGESPRYRCPVCKEPFVLREQTTIPAEPPIKEISFCCLLNGHYEDADAGAEGKALERRWTR